MQSRGEILKMLREERGLSQSQLAEALKVSKSTIGMYETNGRTPKPELLEALADFFNVDMNFLYGRTHVRNSAKELEDLPTNVVCPKMKKVPLIGSIACGKPIYTDQHFGELAQLPDDVSADFALTAQGDSMTGARIYNGDLVFCKTTEMVNNGRIAAVIIGDEATLKRFYYYRDKNLVILKAENPAYEDLIYQGPEISKINVLGEAVALQSKL